MQRLTHTCTHTHTHTNTHSLFPKKQTECIPLLTTSPPPLPLPPSSSSSSFSSWCGKAGHCGRSKVLGKAGLIAPRLLSVSEIHIYAPQHPQMQCTHMRAHTHTISDPPPIRVIYKLTHPYTPLHSMGSTTSMVFSS